MSKRKMICPWCKQTVRTQLVDDEGNWHTDDYINDCFSGIGYILVHENDDKHFCPIATHEREQLGVWIFDTEKEAEEAWKYYGDGD